MLIGLVNGQHPDLVVQGFNAAQDSLTLIGFCAGEAAAALAGAVTAGGSESLTLSDWTHIQFVGVTGIGAGSFI